MDRENKITPRRVLLNISARCLLTPIYYHILLIHQNVVIVIQKLVVHSRLSIQFSHAPNYRVFVQLLTLISLQFRNHHRAIRRFPTHFTLSATTDYYREIVHLILLPIFQFASPHSLKNIIPNKSPHIPLLQCSSTNVTIIVPQNLLLQMKPELVLSVRQRKVIEFIFKIFLNQSTNEHL